MLFLFSPRGMGITPIIRPPVVNGTFIPLLFLPHYHSFGTNESQPPRGFVLDAPIVMLKTGIAFLAWFLCLAVLKETANSEPGTVSTGLTSLRVETSGKGILFGKDGTVALQIVLVDTTLIHPETKALVPDELHGANGFIDSSILLFRPIYLVLVYKHLVFFLSLCYTDYTS
jgi:hypothetical protein